MQWFDTGELLLSFECRGSADRRPALLLHELGGSSFSWSYLAPMLMEHQVFVLDLRGSGGSEKVRRPYEMSDLARDVAKFMRGTRPDETWDIIGCAFGGFLALQTALKVENARSLVVCQVTEGLGQDASRFVLDRADLVIREGMASAVDVSLSRSFPVSVGKPDAAFLSEYRNRWRCQDPDSYAAQSRAIARLDQNQLPLRRLTIPTLVLFGEIDHLWSADQAEAFARTLPNAEYALLRDAGHFPHIQNPSEFAKRVHEFWDRLNRVAI